MFDDDAAPGNAYRDGKIHVLATKCATCIFRPGNLMSLQPGRVRDMVQDAQRDDTAIICHSTLYQPGIGNAVCRGFYDRYETTPLQLAHRLGLIREVPAPD